MKPVLFEMKYFFDSTNPDRYLVHYAKSLDFLYEGIRSWNNYYNVVPNLIIRVIFEKNTDHEIYLDNFVLPSILDFYSIVYDHIRKYRQSFAASFFVMDNQKISFYRYKNKQWRQSDYSFAMQSAAKNMSLVKRLLKTDYFFTLSAQDQQYHFFMKPERVYYLLLDVFRNQNPLLSLQTAYYLLESFYKQYPDYVDKLSMYDKQLIFAKFLPNQNLYQIQNWKKFINLFRDGNTVFVQLLQDHYVSIQNMLEEIIQEQNS